MKRILTLLMVAGAFTAANAQSREETRRVILGDDNGSIAKNGGYGNGRDVILGGGNNGSYPTYPGNNYPSGNNNRQYQIDQVNREYDVKIQSIRNNGYLSYDEKQRSIRQLERDRQMRIQQVNNAYNNGNCNDNDDRRDNGKHKGWDKNKNKKNNRN